MMRDRNDQKTVSVFKNPVRTLKSEELIKVSGGISEFEEIGHNKPSAIPDDASGFFR